MWQRLNAFCMKGGLHILCIRSKLELQVLRPGKFTPCAWLVSGSAPAVARHAVCLTVLQYIDMAFSTSSVLIEQVMYSGGVCHTHAYALWPWV